MTDKTIFIKNVCDLNSHSIKKSDRLEVIQYLDTGNITRNKIDNVQFFGNNSTSLPSRAQRKVKKNTILYSLVRPIQEHFGILINPDDNLIVSTGFVTINVKDEEIIPKFLYYMLTQKSITKYLQTIAENNASSYPAINVEDIGNLQLKIPSSKENQQKIADVLSTLDAKIELNNTINAELEVMAKTLYEYWFVQFDFPDKNGKPYKSSGGKMIYDRALKKHIPKDWAVTPLSLITPIGTEILTPADLPEKEYKYFSILFLIKQKPMGLNVDSRSVVINFQYSLEICWCLN